MRRTFDEVLRSELNPQLCGEIEVRKIGESVVDHLRCLRFTLIPLNQEALVSNRNTKNNYFIIKSVTHHFLWGDG